MTISADPTSSSASLPMVSASAGVTFCTVPSTTEAIVPYDMEPA